MRYAYLCNLLSCLHLPHCCFSCIFRIDNTPNLASCLLRCRCQRTPLTLCCEGITTGQGRMSVSEPSIPTPKTPIESSNLPNKRLKSTSEVGVICCRFTMIPCLVYYIVCTMVDAYLLLYLWLSKLSYSWAQLLRTSTGVSLVCHRYKTQFDARAL